ncbi:hypothetical protein NE237_009504 [Protea cynaroides]|uniref:Uncharacterized protein n=1 Tax=Protea cynaroides TaxID=273540 RepID=A0A9Q0KY27_9MAGN|nr:hypothetical protein NE237_009504 [Protea cynaroides]
MMSVVNQDRVDNELGFSETAKDVTQGKMLTDDNAEQKWREKNVEEDDGLRIVECLRGRLLAERTASRVAKEETEQMENKVIELERQLKAEIESKNRAEKKLKYLTKKLESLKLTSISDELSSSETSSGLKSTKQEKTDSEIAGSSCSVITGYCYNKRDFPAEEQGKVDDSVSSKELQVTDDQGFRYKFRNRSDLSFQSVHLLRGFSREIRIDQ